MKLELVLLTILVSSVTERQVEANPDRLECYQFRNLTGANVTLYGDTTYFRARYRFEIQACTVYGTWVFFSDDYYYGKVNAISGTGTIYYPRERFVVESMWLVPNKGNESGIFGCKETGYKYRRFNYFSNETRNIGGRKIWKAAIVIGSKDWTVESKCTGANCTNDQTCFPAPPAGKVLFITKISNLGRILSITPGKCLGNKIAGRTIVPGCICNWRGAVNDAERCNGKNGTCNCLSTHTGYDCGWCKEPKIIQGDGTCKEAEDCGCDPRGVDNDYSCKNGRCNCNPYTVGHKCDGCINSASFVRRACRYCYCKYDRVEPSKKCLDDTGKCNCLKQFVGDKCERCATNYYPLGKSCFDESQHNQTIVLKDYCNKKDTPKEPSQLEVLIHMEAMLNKGTFDSLPWVYYQLMMGQEKPGRAACRAYSVLS